MNETKYLVDTNALLAITAARRQTPFFRAHCRVPEEVLHEARFQRDRSALCELVYATTPSVLEQTRRVVTAISVGDTTLLDLYGNKGAADPILIACALDAGLRGESELMPDEWVIVTNDKAVVRQAAEFGVTTRSPWELVSLIDMPR